MPISSILQCDWRRGAINPRVVEMMFGYLTEFVAPRYSEIKDSLNYLEAASTTDGTYEIVSVLTDEPTTYLTHSFGPIDDYYYQIWLIPQVLSVTNFEFDSGIPFLFWNSYPFDNAITSITITGSSGVETELNVGDNFEALETRIVTVSVTEAAGFTGITHFNFGMEWGFGLLDFYFQTTSRVSEILPEVPITETWSWKTDIIMSSNNHIEQRVAVRLSPRVSTAYKMLMFDDVDRRLNYARIFDEMKSFRLVPFYQYASKLTAVAHMTDTRIYFDPRKSDVRVGEFVYLYSSDMRFFDAYQIATVETDGATLVNPVENNFDIGSFAISGVQCLLTQNSGFNMANVYGDLNIEAMRLYPREDFARPEATPTITRLNSRPVIGQRFLANKTIDEKFEMNNTLIDADTGVYTVIRNRKYPFIAGTVEFKVKRIENPDAMDYWRALFAELRGMQGSFYLPTWRRDFKVNTDIVVHSMNIICDDNRFKELYEGLPEFTNIQFLANDGETVYREIVSSSLVGSDLTLVINEALPDDSKWQTKNIIVSFLYLCRMTSDDVKWDHNARESFFDLSFKTVSQ
jgi:hypothetical protein